MRYHELSEARRNADHPVQQRNSSFDTLKRYFDESWLSDTYGVTLADVFISFTRIDKIGINPKSGYTTPIGVYCYPLQDYRDAFIASNAIRVPFAGSNPYINVLIKKDGVRVLNLATYSKDDLLRDKNLLKSYYSEKYPENSGMFNTIYNNNSHHSMEIAKNIWYFTSALATNIVNNTRGVNRHSTRHDSILWNYLLRKVLGYGLVYDDGKSGGIIHQNEPTQAAFLSVESFMKVETISNDWHNSRKLMNIINDGDAAKLSSIPSRVVLASLLKNADNIKYVRYKNIPNSYFDVTADEAKILFFNSFDFINKIKSIRGDLENIDEIVIGKFENALLTSGEYVEHIIHYISKLRPKTRWKDFEDILLSDVYSIDRRTMLILFYINLVIKDRWPAAESILKHDPDIYDHYVSLYLPEEHEKENELRKNIPVGSRIRLKNGKIVTILRNTTLDRILVITDDEYRGNISYTDIKDFGV